MTVLIERGDMKQALQHFVDRAAALTKSDLRLLGMAVSGSWASGGLDDFSDLDIIIVASDDSFPSIFVERFKIMNSLGENFSVFTGEHVGEPRLLICLYKSPLIHVDLKFVKISDFHERIEDPSIIWERGGSLSAVIQSTSAEPLEPDLQYLEDRIWTWLHYGAAKAARGELFEAVSMLNFIRETVLGPIALWQAGKQARGVRWLERDAPVFAVELQKTLPHTHDSRSCYNCLLAAADIYCDLRSRFPNSTVRTNPVSEQEVRSYIHAKIKLGGA